MKGSERVIHIYSIKNKNHQKAFAKSSLFLLTCTICLILHGCSNSVSNEHYSIVLISAQTGRGGTIISIKLKTKSSGGKWPDFYQTKMILPEETTVPVRGSFKPTEVSETFSFEEGKKGVDNVLELKFQKISKHFYLEFPEFPQMEIKIREYLK